MKKLAVKTVCSVAAVLAVVFGMNTDLVTSQRGLEHIANLEGCRTQAYQCSANKWTNGLGHTSGVSEGDTVTIEEVATNYVEDVKAAEQVVISNLKVDVTSAQFDVLVSFVFNLGQGNFKRSTLLKKFNNGDATGACQEFIRWVYVNGKDCRIDTNNCSGIVKRRIIERDVCLNGWPQQ